MGTFVFWCDVLWNMRQVNCGICVIGLLSLTFRFRQEHSSDHSDSKNRSLTIMLVTATVLMTVLLTPNLATLTLFPILTNTASQDYLTVSHYNDVIMGTIASQVISLTIVYSTVYSDADQRKHQSSASLAFVRGIHGDRWQMASNGLVPLGNKPLHETMLTRSLSPYGVTRQQLVNISISV